MKKITQAEPKRACSKSAHKARSTINYSPHAVHSQHSLFFLLWLLIATLLYLTFDPTTLQVVWYVFWIMLINSN